MTQKIDITKPLELDDGTPVELVSNNIEGESILVRLPSGKSCGRRTAGFVGDGRGHYDSSTGIWCGGSADRQFTLRNTQENPAVLKVGDKVYQPTQPDVTGVVIAADDARIVIESDKSKAFTRRNPDGTSNHGYPAWAKQPEKPEQVVKYSAMLTLGGMLGSDKGAGGRTAAIGFNGLGYGAENLATVRSGDWAGVALKTTYENNIPVAVELVTKP